MSEFVEAVMAGAAVFVVCSVLYLLNRAAYVEKVAGPAPAVLSGVSETLDERIQRECAEQLDPHLAHIKTELHKAYCDGLHRSDIEVVVPESFREEMIGWTVYGVSIRRDRLAAEPTVWPKAKETW